jgi:hypothetical protein
MLRQVLWLDAIELLLNPEAHYHYEAMRFLPLAVLYVWRDSRFKIIDIIRK